jgi:hypothetical protein
MFFMEWIVRKREWRRAGFRVRRGGMDGRRGLKRACRLLIIVVFLQSGHYRVFLFELGATFVSNSEAPAMVFFFLPELQATQHHIVPCTQQLGCRQLLYTSLTL